MNVSQELQPVAKTKPGVCWWDVGQTLGELPLRRWGGDCQLETNLRFPHSHRAFPGGGG